MKKQRTGFRVEIFWEEFGTTAEGSMEDCRHHEIHREPTDAEMTEIENGLRELLLRIGLLADKKGSKLKPLPIWSLEVGDRVRVKIGVKHFSGEFGEVVELHPGKYVVRLDIHRHSRIFGHYTRNELMKVKR